MYRKLSNLKSTTIFDQTIDQSVNIEVDEI